MAGVPSPLSPVPPFLLSLFLATLPSPIKLATQARTHKTLSINGCILYESLSCTVNFVSSFGEAEMAQWFSSLLREVFLRVLRFSLSSKTNIPNSNSIWIIVKTHYHEPLAREAREIAQAVPVLLTLNKLHLHLV